MPPSRRSRRKAKPSFEIPVEAGSRETPVGWVYRAEEPAAQTPAVIPITSGTLAERLTPGDAKPAAVPVAPTPAGLDTPTVSARPYHPAVIAGASLFYIGAGSVVLVSLTALTLIGKPFKRLFGIGQNLG